MELKKYFHNYSFYKNKLLYIQKEYIAYRNAMF